MTEPWTANAGGRVDDALIAGLLNTLERELLPAIERAEPGAWGRANRVADAVLALLPDSEVDSASLPLQRVGALQVLYAAAREGRGDTAARSCALHTFVSRARDAIGWRRSRPPSLRVPRHSVLPPPPSHQALPSWLPESRVLGGFRILRPMASGGLGSIFRAQRVEDENDPLAPEVVVKVPNGPGELAAHIDEEELLAAFRAEASALAAIPLHPNLARILAFDVAARPKPFLVMELVEGRTLEEELASGALTMGDALAILDGVLSGLDAMHATGVGHLDVKPDNVILRRQTGDASLVDFGLSGRTVRKRCGNPLYAAPEVWNDDRHPESAFAADAYSFACLAFETLTGQVLFDGDDLFTVVRAHLGHDGWPAPLAALRARPELRKLAEVLSRALRANPAQRTRVRMLRTELRRLAPSIQDVPWPARVPERWASTRFAASSGADDSDTFPAADGTLPH